MEYKNVFGSYVPSYLLIKLRTTGSLHKITALDEADKKDFLHEYSHFLQDITGGFGHSHMWYMHDCFRQVIAREQKNGKNELHLPVMDQMPESEIHIIEVMKSIEGSYRAPSRIDDSSTFIENSNFYTEPAFKKLYPGKEQPWFLNLHLKDAQGRKADYSFGEAAVSEMMAYLIETKYFGYSALNNFPYKVCKKIGEYLETELTQNDEWLFALCDVAMISHYPGMMFYRILQNMARREFVPQESEEIYDYGINFMQHALKWDVFGDFLRSKNGAIKVLEEMFNNEFLKETFEWVRLLLERGYEARASKPSLLLNLYREARPFEGFWNKMYEDFGTPQVHNGKNERFFAPPHKLKSKTDLIEPLWLLSTQQVHDTLVSKKTRCGLFECCEKSTVDFGADYDCVTAPWERIKKDKVCAYSALWISYGLDKKKVLLSEEG